MGMIGKRGGEMPNQKVISHETGDPRTAYESIGTQRERTLHRAIKYYLCPDEASHEIKIGRYIADICQGQTITEIQTGSFGSLKGKLRALLPDYFIRIVYPVARKKTLHVIDELGILSSPRRSPKTGTWLEIGKELVRILDFLHHPHLEFLIFLVDVDEYRTKTIVTSRRKTSDRIDQYPKGEPVVYPLRSPMDYRHLFPTGLISPFTAKAFQQAAKLGTTASVGALRVFRELGIVVPTGKQGRATLYSLVEENL